MSLFALSRLSLSMCLYLPLVVLGGLVWYFMFALGCLYLPLGVLGGLVCLRWLSLSLFALSRPCLVFVFVYVTTSSNQPPISGLISPDTRPRTKHNT